MSGGFSDMGSKKKQPKPPVGGKVHDDKYADQKKGTKKKKTK